MALACHVVIINLGCRRLPLLKTPVVQNAMTGQTGIAKRNPATPGSNPNLLFFKELNLLAYWHAGCISHCQSPL
jgi:hypothetical protein